MIGISVSGVERVSAKLGQAVTDMRAATDRAMRRATILVGNAIKGELSDSAVYDPFWGKKGSAGQGLSVRSGSTRASITAGTLVYRVGDRVIGIVGSAQKHLLLHEDGGTISGKSGKGYLRIPTANAMTPAGVDRWAGKSIRDIPGAFLRRTSTGRLWAMRDAGGKHAGARVDFLYLLVRSIKVKARHIFARTAGNMPPAVKGAVGEQVSAVVQKANS